MDGFLPWIARLFGVEVPAGAELSLELGGFPTGGAAVLVLASLAAAVPFAWWCYRRDAAGAPRALLAAMVGLRAAALILLGLVLLEPQLFWPDRAVDPGRVTVFVDTSSSMAVADAGEPEVPRSRLEAAVDLLRADGFEVLRNLARDNAVQVVTFGATPQELGGLPWSPDGLDRSDPALARLSEALATLAPDQVATDPGEGLRTVLRQTGAERTAGLFWLTDGRRNRGDLPQDVALLASQRGVPAAVGMGFGAVDLPRSVGIARVDAPERVFAGDPFDVAVQLSIQGRGDGTRDLCVMRLLRGDPERPEAPLVQVARREVPLPVGAPAASGLTVAFRGLDAGAPGVARWEVELQWVAADGDRFDRRDWTMETLSERVRVLLLAGGPSPEYRALRNLLLRDDSIDVACWLQSAARDFPQDGDPGVRLERLPTDRSGLAPFDAVILVDPDPSRVPVGFGANLAEQVSTAGVGLWWVTGELFVLPALEPGGSLAPLGQLLPVVADRASAERRVYGLRRGFSREWPWQVADGAAAGVAGGLLRTQADEAGATPWEELPGLHVALPITGLKAGAAALLVHGDPGQTQVDGAPMPVVAAQHAGAGRVLFSGSDETYRWQAVAPAMWQGFWVRGLRWLHEGRLAAGKGLVRLRLGSEEVVLGETVQVDAVAERPDRTPDPSAELALMWLPPRGDGGGTETVPFNLPALPGEPGRFAGGFAPDRTGTWQLVPTTDGRPVSLRVIQPPTEPGGPRDDVALAALVGSSGHVVGPDGAGLQGALGVIPSRSIVRVTPQRAALWDNGWMLGLLLLLLTVEWILRKRANLL